MSRFEAVDDVLGHVLRCFCAHFDIRANLVHAETNTGKKNILQPIRFGFSRKFPLVTLE